MRISKDSPPIPQGSIVPIANRLASKYVFDDLAPTKNVGKSASLKEVLKGGMFGAKKLKEGPIQTALSRNYQPLDVYKNLKLGLSKEEYEEVLPLLNLIQLAFRKKMSTIDSKYESHGARGGIVPQKLAQCMEDEKILWLAEEEKIQEYLDNLPKPLKDKLEKLNKTVDILRTAKLDPHQIDINIKVPVEVYQMLSDIHGLAYRIPKEYGGEGLNQKQYGAVLRTHVRDRSGTKEGIVSAHNTIGAAPLLRFGTKEQIGKYIPLMLKGEFTCAFALTEPWSGTDAFGKMATVARLSPDGKNFILNGAKIFTTNFHTSGVAYVITKFDDGKGNYLPATFIVDLPFRITDTEVDTEAKIKELAKEDRKGGNIYAANPQRLMTIRGSNQGFWEMKDLVVPAENLLGNIGDQVAFESLNEGRAGFADACSEGARCALEEVTHYVVQREIFAMYGGKLSNLPHIKKIISEMAVRTAAVNAASEVTDALIDQHGNDTGLMAECAVIKALASSESNRVIELAQEVFGGVGLMQGIGVEREVRDARVTRTVEGVDPAMLQFHFASGARPAQKELVEVFKGERHILTGLFGLMKPAFKFVTGGFKFMDAFGIQVRTKMLGLKNLIMSLRYGNEAALQQNTVMKYAGQNADHFALICALTKLEDKTQAMPHEERIALEQYVKNNRFGFLSFSRYWNPYPTEIADVYINKAIKHVNERIQEENELIKSYKERHGIA